MKTETELRELLASLTLEEKVGQLVQLSGEFFSDDEGLKTGPTQKLGIDPTMVELAGSVLNVAGAEKTRAVQEAYLAKSRHKIPLLFMNDVVYGCKTVLPIPLGFAASWDPDLVRECYAGAAEEARAMGIHVTFAPMLDLVRDARWGRSLESPGEDPWLTSVYARAMVEGFQGDDLARAGIASCIKHFAGYGAVEAGRDYNTVDMSERRLREMYLPPYRAAVEAGCRAVMPSFNVIDEVPATANTWLLRDVLRGEWGFDGAVVTDYAAISELVPHGVAADDAEAARLALEAGVDVDMKTACYANNLCDLVRSGAVDEALVDEACLRVLTLKNDLGLFDDPYRGASPAEEERTFLTDEKRARARKLADESIVLLKNERDLLPLDPQGEGRIALIGPYAESHALIGLWAVQGDPASVPTLAEALTEIAGDRVTCAQGSPYLVDESSLGFFGRSGAGDAAWDEDSLGALREEALAVAREADVVIMALGEHPMESGEGGSKADLRLPAIQRELLREVHALGKPVVGVIFSGRTPVLSDIAPWCDALIEAWFPGTEGTHALADILFGVVNPSGRTAMTFPYATGQEPLYYNAFNTGRPEKTSGHTNRFTSRYVDCPTDPLYPFGYGLSYTTFAYENLRASSETLTADGTLEVSVDVTNTGRMAGDEVVQLYVRDLVGSVVRPVKELKGFERVHLEPGERRTVSFTIDEPMLRFWRRDLTFGSEPGAFEVMVGPHSAEVQTLPFTLVA